MKVRELAGKDDLEKEIQNSREPMIVLFAADWCGYCKQFLSVVSDYEAKPGRLDAHNGTLLVVDIDSGDGGLWDKYKVDLVPTLVVFSKGSEVFRRDGKLFVGLKETDLEEAVKKAAAL